MTRLTYYDMVPNHDPAPPKRKHKCGCGNEISINREVCDRCESERLEEEAKAEIDGLPERVAELEARIAALEDALRV